MTQNADNIAVVRPVVNGAAWRADTGTDVPNSATTELPAGYASLGWLTEDGISMTVDRQVKDLKGFGGDTALTLQESHDVEFKFKPMEWNVAVMREMFGKDNVTDAGTIKVNSKDLPVHQYVFDLRGRGNKLVRIVVPRCKITSFAEIPFKHNEPIAAEFTLKAYPDDAGNKVYIYNYDPAND